MSNSLSSRILVCLIVLTFCLSGCGKKNNDSIIEEDLFRHFRLNYSMWNNMGKPIEYLQWHDGKFKKTSDIVYKTNTFGEEERTVAMVKYLLIPNAPFIGRTRKGEVYLLGPNDVPQKVGDRAYVTVDLPKDGKRTLEMEKSPHSRGKWLGYNRGNIYEYGDDKVLKHIGFGKFKKLRIESGITVTFFMTKGLKEGDSWVGELENITYRENENSRAEPYQRLEYKKVKLPDEKETFLLMAQSIDGKSKWAGAFNGEVIEE